MSGIAVRVLDVIWPRDRLTYPPTWKMWATMSPEDGWFFRINTDGSQPGSVALPRATHPFLAHDSYLGCGGDLIEVDEESLRLALDGQSIGERRGVIGRIDRGLVPQIALALRSSERLTGIQVDRLLGALRDA